MLNQRIQGLYAITPDKGFDMALMENAIKKHKVNILQYRRKTLDIKNKLYRNNNPFICHEMPIYFQLSRQLILI